MINLDTYIKYFLFAVLAIIILIIIGSFAKQMKITVERFGNETTTTQAQTTTTTIPRTTSPLQAAVREGDLKINEARYQINDSNLKLDSLADRLNKIKLNLIKIKKISNPDSPADVVFY